MDVDIHICGKCRQEFNVLDEYVSHKNKGCSQISNTATTSSISPRISSSGQIAPQCNGLDVPQRSAPLPGDTKPSSDGVGSNSTTQQISSMSHPGIHAVVKPEVETLETSITASGPSMPENAAIASDSMSKVQIHIPGSDQMVTLNMSLSEQSAILQAVSHPSEFQESKAGLVSTVNDGTLSQLLTMTSSGEVVVQQDSDGSSNIVLRDSAPTPQLADDMVATAGTDLITEPSKPLPHIINEYGQKKYICSYEQCKFQTVYARDLERHIRVHTGEKPFVCMVCDRAFNRADKLKIHMRGHTGEKPYQCNQCDYAAADSSSLKMHFRIHTNERPFKCQICPYASRNSSQLIVHLRTHTGDCPFQCQICQAKFKINSDLKRHMRLHTGEKPFSCDLCDYKCAIKGNLKVHHKINHDASNASKCPHCEFASSSKRMYREHLKCHDMKERQVPCPRCDYRCLNQAALKAHLRSHSDEKPYKCNYCGYSCKQSGNLKTHVKRKHAEKLMAIKVLAMKKAGMLKKAKGEDLTKVNLSSLLTNVGTSNSRGKKSEPAVPMKNKPFKCDHCDAAFVREDSLKSHVRQHVQLEIAQKEITQTLDVSTFSMIQLQNPMAAGLGTVVAQNYTAAQTAALAQATLDEHRDRLELNEMTEHDATTSLLEDANHLITDEKTEAENFLREFEATLGQSRKVKKARSPKAEKTVLSNAKRGRPKVQKGAKPRVNKDSTINKMFRKPKGDRSPSKKKRKSEEGHTIVLQQMGMPIQHSQQATVINGQIQLQTGPPPQIIATTVPRMSPHANGIITNDQSYGINQGNSVMFVQSPTNDNMRQVQTATAQQAGGGQTRIIATSQNKNITAGHHMMKPQLEPICYAATQDGTIPLTMTQINNMSTQQQHQQQQQTQQQAQQQQATQQQQGTTMEQLVNHDGTTILQTIAPSHITHLDGSGLASVASNTVQTGFIDTQSAATHMTMSHGGTTTVFPQATFLLPSGQGSVIFNRGPNAQQSTTGHTVNMQPVVAQQFMTQGHAGTLQPIQMDMTQHQQQQQQQHPQQQQQQTQVLRIASAPQQT